MPKAKAEAPAAPIWFYHLERSSLDDVLPELVDRCLKRAWRVLIRASDSGLLGEIDDRLWAWRDDAFLAHGRAEEPHADRQPVLLTTGMENPNGAQALFIVDGAELGATKGFERCMIIFDGRDEAALTGARARWKALKEAGADLAYWRQSAEGSWEQAA